MKILPFKIPKSTTETLIVQKDKGIVFYDKLHQHREIQITLIKKGEGTFIIGDAIGEFKTNDIFIIGEDLPHVFKTDIKEDLPDEEVEMLSLFFTKNSFGEEFFELPELEHLKQLLSNSSLGLKVMPKNNEIKNAILNIEYLNKFQRFMSFLDILSILSQTPNQVLSSLLIRKKYTEDEGKRMDAIFQFAMNQFHRNILLDEVADIANMTPNAFCRYFKQRTNKTFIRFLTEIRIGNACKLLAKNEDLNIMDICYKSGFNNLANFNRKFKELKGITPSAYRKRHFR